MSDPGPAYDSHDASGERIRPLTMVALGVFVIVLDLGAEGFDLLPDPVGWVLVVLGLAPLRDRHIGLTVAYWTSIALVPLSLLLLSATDLLSDGAARAAGLLDIASSFAARVGVLVGIMALTRVDRTRVVAATLIVLASVAAVLGVVGEFSGPADQAAPNREVPTLIIVAALAGAAMLVAALIWLYRVGAEPEFAR